MQADLLRQKFLEFFKSKKHKIVESDSLVPGDDPTVLFTPAGMNQFKKEFLGYNSGFSRAVTAQRCLRTDDLDKVGKTASHHTFFEMLGNFSFGDYFKKEAIAWAWEFLTQKLGISPEKLWVSVYKDDNESHDIWQEEIKIPAHKIIRLGDKDNFWPAEAKAKGPNGPCGPCSEIFFDQGKTIGCGKPDCSPACSCGRFTEVWNLVFTQFNRKESGALEPLPKKNIDTGMGLERLAAVMQGVSNNFETDLFKPLVKEIEKEAPGNVTKEFIYAVSDHIRAIVFSIYDGALPSNEGRGYVIRKIIRKSVLHLRQLGIEKPFLYKLVPVLAEIMKAPYPELSGRREDVAQVIQAEEKNFINILNSSHALFAKIPLKACAEKIGEAVFKLHDTYGIPPEEIEKWLKKQGVKDLSAIAGVVSKKFEEQRQRSKSQSAMKGDVFDSKGLNVSGSASSFSGYKNNAVKAKILKIIQNDAQVKKITKGQEAKIILDKSVFYAESGGQAGDSGEIRKGKNVFEVFDTHKIGKAIIHSGSVREGSFKNNDAVLAAIDYQRRLDIARNHTATHLLQAVLRKVLGSHVQQQGSLVTAGKLRFDFTHFKDIENEELARIEELVNSCILDNSSLSTKQMSLKEAKRKGALAFFGEKYESKVRVVSIAGVSSELCGGTHLDYTGQIGIFKIIHEGSVASGVRRIEAVTGKQAYKVIKDEARALADISALLNVPIERAAAELNKRLGRIRELEKEVSLKKTDSLKNSIDSDIHSAQSLSGINLITHAGADSDSVRKAVDLIKERVKENTVIFSSTAGNLQDRVFVVIGITDDLCNRGLDAGQLIREVSKQIGGSGGGRKDFAQAGGNNPKGLDQALEKIKELIKGAK